MSKSFLILFGLGMALFCSDAHSQELQSYSYDEHGRLTSTNRDTPAYAGVTSYVLDKANNRSERWAGSAVAQSWEAENLYHVVGFADGDGWAANVQQPEGVLVYGPYLPAPVGNRVAVYRMMIDVANVPDAGPVVWVDVWDATAGQQLAAMNISRATFRANWTYQSFELPFEISSARAAHVLEYRVYFYPKAHVRVDKVGFR